VGPRTVLDAVAKRTLSFENKSEVFLISNNDLWHVFGSVIAHAAVRVQSSIIYNPVLHYYKTISEFAHKIKYHLPRIGLNHSSTKNWPTALSCPTPTPSVRQMNFYTYRKVANAQASVLAALIQLIWVTKFYFKRPLHNNSSRSTLHLQGYIMGISSITWNSLKMRNIYKKKMLQVNEL